MKGDQIQDILFQGENILWQGQPKRIPYIFRNSVALFPVACIFFAFDAFFIYTAFSLGDVPKEMVIFMIGFFALHLLPVWVFAGKFLKSIAEHKNIQYAVTDRRIIARSGLMGVDFNSADYGDITDVRVNVSPIERLCNCGTVSIATGAGTIDFLSVQEPYVLYKQLNKILIDLKYDMHYPNAYRPQTNPGYNTEYRP